MMRVVLAGLRAPALRYVWTWLWPFVVVLLLVSPLSVRDWMWNDVMRDGVFLGMILLIGVGQSVTAVSSELAAKPISFCLPGYHESLRTVAFTSAILWGLLFLNIVVLIHPGSPDGATGLAHAVAWFLGGVVLGLFTTASQFAPSIRVTVVEVVFAGWFMLAALIATAVAATYPPIIAPGVIVISIVLCILFWRYLGDAECLRDDHREVIEEALKRPPRAVLNEAGSSSVEAWFLSRARKSRVAGTWRYICACFYCTLSSTRLPGTWWLILLLWITLFLGAVGDGLTQCVLLMLLTLASPWPMQFDILLPAGRRERFSGAVATAAATTLWLIVIGAAISVLSEATSRFMAGIGFSSAGSPYTAVCFRLIGLLCLLMPWFFTLRLFFPRRPNVRAVIIWGVYPLFITELIFHHTVARILETLMNPPVFIPSLLAGWAVFLLFLHRACMRWNLTVSRGGARR
jgi:hypothetical protein